MAVEKLGLRITLQSLERQLITGYKLITIDDEVATQALTDEEIESIKKKITDIKSKLITP